MATLSTRRFHPHTPFNFTSSHIKRLPLHTKQQRRHASLFTSYLVSPLALSHALTKNIPTRISTAPRIIPLCASWFLPNDPQSRTGPQTFHSSRIPSARFFDLDGVKDHESPYPHMLPTASDFAAAMRKLGIRRDDEIVVYDTEELGIFSAPRVGWTLRVFGHPSVHILNNYRLWVKQGFPTESGPPQEISQEEQELSKYPIPNANPDLVVKFAEVKDIAKSSSSPNSTTNTNNNPQNSTSNPTTTTNEIQILDARSHARWAGVAPEPRPGLQSGHIPGSTNVPITDLLDRETGALLSREELRRIFEQKGVDPKKPIVSSCGTGVTACVVDAALGEAGWGREDDRRVYDGSWTEWAMRVKEGEGLIRKEGERRG